MSAAFTLWGFHFSTFPQTGERREILHFHYTTWPDFGVPESPASFLNFLFKVRESGCLNADEGPVVVHCSAGIGRSGTFCLVDTCLLLVCSPLFQTFQPSWDWSPSPWPNVCRCPAAKTRPRCGSVKCCWRCDAVVWAWFRQQISFASPTSPSLKVPSTSMATRLCRSVTGETNRSGSTKTKVFEAFLPLQDSWRELSNEEDTPPEFSPPPPLPPPRETHNGKRETQSPPEFDRIIQHAEICSLGWIPRYFLNAPLRIVAVSVLSIVKRKLFLNARFCSAPLRYLWVIPVPFFHSELVKVQRCGRGAWPPRGLPPTVPIGSTAAGKVEMAPPHLRGCWRRRQSSQRRAWQSPGPLF